MLYKKDNVYSLGAEGEPLYLKDILKEEGAPVIRVELRESWAKALLNEFEHRLNLKAKEVVYCYPEGRSYFLQGKYYEWGGEEYDIDKHPRASTFMFAFSDLLVLRNILIGISETFEPCQKIFWRKYPTVKTYENDKNTYFHCRIATLPLDRETNKDYY